MAYRACYAVDEPCSGRFSGGKAERLNRAASAAFFAERVGCVPLTLIWKRHEPDALRKKRCACGSVTRSRLRSRFLLNHLARNEREQFQVVGEEDFHTDQILVGCDLHISPDRFREVGE